MRVAVVSDVHSNLHALEAVLADIDRERADAVWSLGDVVGYGPQPNRCAELVATHADVSLCGNHDLAALGLLELDDFAPEAAEAARWTSSALTAENREYLRSLEPRAETPQAVLVHGSPRDPVWEYVLSPDAALAALESAGTSLLLVGHSHVPLALQLADGLEGGLAPDGTQVGLDTDTQRLLNPGSVGQPRDGDPRAAWLLLDFGELAASFRRVPYAIARTQAEIREARLPLSFATRLASGT